MRTKPALLRDSTRRLRTLFLVTGAALLGGLGASYLSGQAALRSMAELQHYDNSIEQLQDFLTTALTAESGRRGFLLSRERQYLQPYIEAESAIGKRMGALQEAAEKGILPAERVARLDELTKRKLTELQDTIDLAQTGRTASALALMKSSQGDAIMEEIRKTVLELRDQQENGRTTAAEEVVGATHTRGFVFILAAVVTLAFLIWAYGRIRREMAQQYVAVLETQRQREILSVTLASIGDAVILTDTSARITFMNVVAERLTGWKASEAAGKACSEVFRIVNESSRASVESPVEKVLKEGAIVGLANHTLLIRKDGTEVPVDDSGAPIRESDGTIRGVVLVFRDFTSHKQAERLLLEAKEHIESASRAKDHFLANLSHELRTPLTPVLATLTTWQTRDDVPPALLPEVTMLRRNVELEARLIDDLLDLTRIEHGVLELKKKQTDVHQALQSAAAIFSETCREKKLRVSFVFDANDNHVTADPERLQQVFWNIIGNAVKFTQEGGAIQISTKNPRPGELEIVVADNGPGMAPAVLGRLFERFTQGGASAEQKEKGLGLGLFIARALVQAHGGTLRASSPGAGKGSSMIITFPGATAKPPQGPAKAEPPAPPTRKLRILLVEDHQDTAAVMGNVLRELGHEVEFCSTVEAACQSVRDKRFDVIISDIGLPDGTGMDFIRSARAVCKTPAIALSGYGMAEDVQQSLDAGFDEHLTKPVDFDRLRQTLDKLAEPKQTTPSSAV